MDTTGNRAGFACLDDRQDLLRLSTCSVTSVLPGGGASFYADARAGKLHPSVMTVLLAYAYGKPRETTSTEPMVSMSQIEEARHTLRATLQHMTDSPESRSR